ncbi:aspartate--tRNA ligase [Candidatus Dojkabacteria bacterium]|uniref:Aspartate--tRNA ligase n=1 Tax=Candidatus Dojkabacteria bacterium TaxID=2099670 RepID=A0A955RK43_9BACT|nr:aspartate--tRNA ligase [Candidatus Dojkabacteria bacterium]
MKRTLITETPKLVGEKVTLKGWVDSSRGHGKITFMDLRDKTGIVQCVYAGKMKDVTVESVLEIQGVIQARPENMVNKEMETGTVEIEIESFKVLNKSEPIPIPVQGDGYDVNEEMRLKYRYVDMRRERMAKNMRLRSKFAQSIRNALYEQDFIEVETPLLTQATMEGARDFVVPSRMYPGKFYSLPQSPQQYKQILMSGGIDRYFQLARCLRDENLRADRGFEFTQVDLEVSYTTRDEIMELLETVIKKAVKEVGGKLQKENFPVYTYDQAIKEFGEDKFDLRSEEEKKDGTLAFAWVVDFPFFKEVDIDDAAEVRDGKSGWTFTHNPFSMPKEEHLEWHMEKKNIGKILTTQYDLVCNGWEAGGGSIRAHRPEILRKTYEIMGYGEKEIEANIGHMLRAFELGTPPHGGIAFGFDRLVAILAGETSIKEVIPFPMTYKGNTAVMEAPTEISKEQLQELGLIVEGSEEAAPEKVVGERLRDKVLALLEKSGKEYDHAVHEPTPTSEDSAATRGTRMEEGIKALILKGKKSGENYQFNVPAHAKVDMKKVKAVVGEACEFEKPEVIEKKYKVIIGGVPPFGSIMNLPTYFEKTILDEERAAFNCGVQTESVIMNSKDLVDIVKPELVDVLKA